MPTWSGTVYVAFVIEAYARRILGWRAATSMRTALVLDTIEQAIWTRRREGVTDLAGLTHHHANGSQYASIAFTERLAGAGIDISVGAVGAALDNALAESVIGLFKTELIRRRGPWRTVDHVEAATLGGSTGSTTTGCSRSTATSHRSTWNRRTTVTPPASPRPGSQPNESPDSPGRFIRPWSALPRRAGRLA